MKNLGRIKMIRKIEEFLKGPCFQNFVVKGIVLFILWIIALIPTWVFIIIIWSLFSPIVFWEKFALVILCLLFFGLLQLVVGFAAVLFTIGVFSTKIY